MTEDELNEVIDLEVSSPPLAQRTGDLPDGDELGDLKDFPEDDSRIEAFKRKYGSKK